MGLFDRIPTNFKPGALFQLGKGAKLVPAGQNPAPTDGSILQWRSATGIWSAGNPFPVPLAASEGAILYYSSTTGWTALASPGVVGEVLSVGTGPNFDPAWTVKVFPDAIGLTTNGDLVTRAAGVLDRIGVGAASTVLRGGSAPTYGTIDASYIDNRTRRFWVPATSFIKRIDSTGTAALALQGANTVYPAWSWPDAAIGNVWSALAEIVMPADYVSGAITVKQYLTNLGAGAGNFNVLTEGYFKANATDLNSTAVFTTVQEVTAAPAQNILKIFTTTFTITPGSTDAIWLECGRVKTAGDTLANAMGFLGAMVEYTADM